MPPSTGARYTYPRFCCMPPSLSLQRQRPLVAHRALPGLPARLRCERAEWSNVMGKHDSHRLSPPHAPCSPSAGAVAWPPALLPTPLVSYTNRFSPYLSLLQAIGGNACCCRLTSRAGHPARAPACDFAGRPSTQGWTRSREVPLGWNPAAASIARPMQCNYSMPLKARWSTAPSRRAPSSRSAGASRLKASRR